MNKPRTFLSCDWGTSSFRIRLINAETGEVLKSHEDSEGTLSTYKKWQAAGLEADKRFDFYLAVIAPKVADWFSTFSPSKLLISGMASSSIGMADIPYAKIPFPLDGSGVSFGEFKKEMNGPLLSITLVSGVCSEDDVIRGEETIILGCQFDENATVILPGTHSKHALIRNGIMTGFQTFMTGELFDLLRKHSVLENSVLKPERLNFKHPAFSEGVQLGARSDLFQNLFKVRTRAILEGRNAENGYYFLSGLLIGSELSSVVSDNEEIILIAGENTLEPYTEALQSLGHSFKVQMADKSLITGHMKLLDSLEQSHKKNGRSLPSLIH